MPSLDGGHSAIDIQQQSAPANLDRGHDKGEYHITSAPVTNLSAGQVDADPREWCARAEELDGGRKARVTHVATASVDLDGSHSSDDSQTASAAVSLDGGQCGVEAQNGAASVDLGVGHQRSASQTPVADAMLLLAADTLDDLERVRIATQNRVRSLRDVKGAADSAEEQKMDGLVAALTDLEHQATLELRRRMREHPYGPWVKQTLGIGEKQGARLLAAIGDPTWNDADDRPRRGPAELWAYCGYAPGQKRQKGVKSNWNASAKMRAFLCAESCMKTPTSPFRDVYLTRRAHTAVTQPDWTPGHSHNDALRIVAKEILKDLWRWGRATGAPYPGQAAPAPPRKDLVCA